MDEALKLWQKENMVLEVYTMKEHVVLGRTLLA
jgi:hypothetical protein